MRSRGTASTTCSFSSGSGGRSRRRAGRRVATSAATALEQGALALAAAAGPRAARASGCRDGGRGFPGRCRARRAGPLRTGAANGGRSASAPSTRTFGAPQRSRSAASVRERGRASARPRSRAREDRSRSADQRGLSSGRRAGVEDAARPRRQVGDELRALVLHVERRPRAASSEGARPSGRARRPGTTRGAGSRPASGRAAPRRADAG